MNVPVLADRLRRLFAAPLPDGVLVSVVLPAGDLTVTTAHGLGRAHRGGLVVRCSEFKTGTVLDPTSATTFTIEVDATSVTDVTLTVWVF